MSASRRPLAEHAPVQGTSIATPTGKPAAIASITPFMAHGPLWAKRAAAQTATDPQVQAAFRGMQARAGNAAAASLRRNGAAPGAGGVRPATVADPNAPPTAETAGETPAKVSTKGKPGEGKVEAATTPDGADSSSNANGAMASVEPAPPGAAPAPQQFMEATPEGKVLGPEEVAQKAARAARAMTRPDLAARLDATGAIDTASASAAARAEARLRIATRAPRGFAGGAPRPGAAPKIDPGPIPEAMTALKNKTARPLGEQKLPEVTRSPRGTLPDLSAPVLTPGQVRLVRLGPMAIKLFPLSDAEEKQLLDIRTRLENGQTAKAPAPEPPAKETATPPTPKIPVADRSDAQDPVGKDAAKTPAKLPAEPDAKLKGPDGKPIAPDVAPPTPVPPTSVPIEDTPVSGVDITPEQQIVFEGVVGEIVGKADEMTGKVVEEAAGHHSVYKDGVLNRIAPEIELPGEKPAIKSALVAQAGLLGESLGLTKTQIGEAVTLRKQAVATQRKAAEAKTDAAAKGAADKATAETTQVAEQSQASIEQMQRAIARDKAAAMARRPKPTARERVEDTVKKIREDVAKETGRYNIQFENRKSGISEAVRKQSAAYRMALLQDEIFYGRDRESSFWDHYRDMARARRWADGEIRKLKAVETHMGLAAQKTTDLYIAELAASGRIAFSDLRIWAKSQDFATEDWFGQLDSKLATWEKDAKGESDAFAAGQAQTLRISLAQDLARYNELAAKLKSGDKEAAATYLKSLDEERRTVVLAMASGDVVAGLALGVREDVRRDKQAGLDLAFEAKVMGLPDTPTILRGTLAKLLPSVQPGWDVQKAAEQIFKYGADKTGTDEAKVLGALEGLTPLAVKALRIQYPLLDRGRSLDAALRDEFNSEEMEAANALLEGKVVEGAVGSLRSAFSGWGTDKEAAQHILRTLSTEDRKEVVKLYKTRYGVSLESEIQSEWGLGGDEKGNLELLSEGRIAEADAHAIGATLLVQDSPDGQTVAIDTEEAQKVYDQIRKDVEKQGAERDPPMTSEQIEAEVALRNHEVSLAFNAQYKDALWAKQGKGDGRQSALDVAFGSNFGPKGKAEGELMTAIARNDRPGIQTARLQIEDAGVYADDAAINMVWRNLDQEALADTTRDYGDILRAKDAAELAEKDKADAFGGDELRRQNFIRQQMLARERQLRGNADAVTKTRFNELGLRYERSAGRTLGAMIDANMSGASQNEALARLENKGTLSNYQRFKYSIEGLGTDVPQAKSALAAMTPTELAAARERWKTEHDGESIYGAIIWDTSGREQGDLLDLAIYGTPQNLDDMAKAAQRKFDRDRDDDSGFGASATAHQIQAARDELAFMNDQLAALKNPKLTTRQRRAAADGFDIAVERSLGAIEIQRNTIDSMADTWSMVAAIVTAVIVGLLLAPVSGGGSAVVAAALIASLAGTAAAIGTKALIKGGAYGTEEFATDLAVGAIDAAFAMLTAGLAKGLTGGARGLITPVSESAVQQYLRSMGRVGQAAARAQARAAGAAAKLGTAGALARQVEGKAIFEGMIKAGGFKKLFAQGTAELIEQTVQSVPANLTGALLDERTWRQPGGPMHVLSTTATSTAMGIGMSIGVAGGMAGGRKLLGPLVGQVVTAFSHNTPKPDLPPARDILGRMGKPEDRLADFRRWKVDNPEGGYRDFYRQRQATAGVEVHAEQAARDQVRAARQALLSELPPKARGGYASVPIQTLSAAEFRAIAGDAPGGAAVVYRDGQAIVVIREGANPSAVRPLMGELRDRVFAGSGGMTLEAALPERYRESTPIRRDLSLPSDTVRVKPVPAHGPITGVEIIVGPGVRPVDVALHVGEVRRIRGWMGRLGRARQKLASLAGKVGIDMVNPTDRARFEAAGEVRKLGPIIENRIRRMILAADNPARLRKLERDVEHLLAQQERASKILSGEVTAEPRGYVAAEGLHEDGTPTRSKDADETTTRERPEAQPVRPDAQVARRTGGEGPATRPDVSGAKEITALVPVNAKAPPPPDPLSQIIDFTGRLESARKRLDELRRRAASDIDSQRHLGNLAGDENRLMRHLDRVLEQMREEFDLPWSKLEMDLDNNDHVLALLRHAETELARHDQGAIRFSREQLILLRSYRHVGGEVLSFDAISRRHALELEIRAAEHSVSRLRRTIEHLKSAPHLTFNGVPLSRKLPLPGIVQKKGADGWGYRPPRTSDTTSYWSEMRHRHGYQAELRLSNHIADNLGEHVVWYGDHVTASHGADVISVDPTTGRVTLWDAKFRESGAVQPMSDTFAEPGKLANALAEARQVITNDPRLSPELKAKALANLSKGKYRIATHTAKAPGPGDAGVYPATMGEVREDAK